MKYKTFLTGVSATALLASSALARNFDISGGNLDAALTAYQAQSGVTLMVPSDAVRNAQTAGVKGDIPPDQALILLLKGTGFGFSRDSSGVIAIVPKGRPSSDASDIRLQPMQLAQASPQRAAVETVTVTSSKLGGADVQSIPIAITALSQEQLTATQTAGGPDLVKQVPNLTFTKTNFSGYSIQIRGIGTQAISVTTDPAVAVAFNDMPFIRNHFFEQEFYDLSQAEVLRGPQGTLYGRNATAGVVNLITARPSDQFEAVASADIGNYHERRFEGMVNIPLVDDRFDLRIAGEWTKRQGYSFNELTNSRIDGRDLWSGRMTFGLKPLDNVQMYLVWEHFSEDDDRIRSSKQLCKRDPGLSDVEGESTADAGLVVQAYLSQGCLPASPYSSDAFGVVNGFSLPYYGGLVGAGAGGSIHNPLSANGGVDPYASVTQSRNLRVIDAAINPAYRVKNDVVEIETDYTPVPQMTFVSQTGFNHDFLWSTQDYNRFNTEPGIFAYIPGSFGTLITPAGDFCDPQLGCSNRLVAQDLSTEHAWQLNQEFRLTSSFSGPVNFSLGANYMHYETEENYYVFINTLTMYAAGAPRGGQGRTWVPGISDNSSCLHSGFDYPDPQHPGNPESSCPYIDPNPFGSLNSDGHNYFLSQNPYLLDSYAVFGEANYQILSSLKVVGGLRWTEDRKHFTEIPSELLTTGWGYPPTGVVNQQWDQFTGRVALNWTPKLDITDQTFIYGSYAHGYKAGGANPPGAVLLVLDKATEMANPVHPLTFKPEFIDAFEVGSKNTLLDERLTLNGSAFFYNYKGYQISQIVDRTSVNLNFDAHVKGAELEGSWEPLPGLRFNLSGGYESTNVADGSRAIDLMDRTGGRNDWIVVKPFVTQASNCILPSYVVKYLVSAYPFGISNACGNAYFAHFDPLTGQSYAGPPGESQNFVPIPDYPGFDPLAGTVGDPYTGQNTYNSHDYGPAPNNGAGFEKDLSGNELPNAPHFTLSAGAQYSMPLSSDWAGTLRGDFYWQDGSWARIFNDDPYDKIHGYTNLNLALIFTSQSGWQIMLYDKNVFNTTAITGAFLNSDDTGLTTNVFLTDPKLIGVRVTKNW